MPTRRRNAILVSLVVVLVALGALPGRGLTARAQDATPGVPVVAPNQGPESAGPVLPLAPDAAKWCKVPRFSRAELEAIWREVNAAASPAASPVAEEDEWVEPPAGTPADEATDAAITAAVVEVIACNVNGGDGLRDPNLITEEHQRESLVGVSREEFDDFYPEQAVVPEPEQWLMVYAVRDVRVLADGRVACNPEIVVPGVGHFRDSLIYEQVDGRWLIDESHDGEDIYPRD